MRTWLTVVALPALVMGCAPDYSPNTYSSNAVQQANKVERGIIIGVRPVDVIAGGAVGAATGAAAGGAVGSTAGGNSVTSTLGAVGGALIGGIVGAGTEKAVADTKAWEYIVRKPNGELVSVTQKDETPLSLAQKVLVIAGNQARIVVDYTKDDTPTASPAVAAAPASAEPPAVPAPVSETPLAATSPTTPPPPPTETATPAAATP